MLKLFLRTFRFLAKCKKDNYSNIKEFKEGIPHIGVKEKKDITYNEKGLVEKYKHSNGSSLNKAQYYTEVIDYNNGMFDGKHFHYERKCIKKKDYDYFLKRKKIIGDIALKKIKFKNYGFGVALFFIFFLLGIGIPSLYGINSLNIKWENTGSSDFWKHFKEPMESIVPRSIAPYMNIISFSILIVIISIILLVAIYKILRNNEKYNKIKLIKD
ncbi:Plasmodium exported protein (Pm-fam-a like), unknown function [Plasmodium malariae]|uniref:Fam-m protein n=1 Tax=Plasmodium malariae TaxID=5858 RepID=A0A1A8WJB5_PLAMA|nr:Plasmodium exported protein (Pm-fam-a like), unknown function [Plasmodium malariae]